MKYFSMSPPEHLAEDVNGGYPCDMHQPPSRPQKPYLSRETFLFHALLLSQRNEETGYVPILPFSVGVCPPGRGSTVTDNPTRFNNLQQVNIFKKSND
jgi:hypothetical protein